MTAPGRMASPLRLRSLEALRGVLAVYVLIGHARWLLWAGHAAWLAQPALAWTWPLAYGSAVFRFGREAVLVFFALSGFFIHLSAATAAGPPAPAFSAAAFYRRRVHRLWAPYLFALIVTVVCDAIGRTWFPQLYAARTGDHVLDANIGAGGYDAGAVIPALVMLPSLFERNFGTNGPLWSLAYEVIYYAVYPAWLWLRLRSRASAMVGVPIACVLLHPFVPAGPLSEVVRLYPLWVTGAVLAEQVGRSRPWPAGGVALLGCAGFGGYLLGAPHPVHLAFSAVFVGAAVYLAATWRGSEDAQIHRLLQYLGTRSYSIYIVHFPFLALISAAVFHELGGRPMSGWLGLGGAVLAVVFGCVCFWLCERHFLRRTAGSSLARGGA